jgi:hypothetical protein
MKITKKSIIAASTTMALGLAVFAVVPTYAHSMSDTDRDAKHAEMQAKAEERLVQAVTDGKITAAQKAAIIAKHAEMKAFRESLKDKTKEERKVAMEAKKAELDKWRTDNGIPEGVVLFGHGHRGGMNR